MKRRRSSQILVDNLGRETTSEEIRVLVSSIAKPLRVTVATDAAAGARRFAVVEFPGPEIAARAIREFDGLELGGRRLRVDPSRPTVARARHARSSRGVRRRGSSL